MFTKDRLLKRDAPPLPSTRRNNITSYNPFFRKNPGNDDSESTSSDDEEDVNMMPPPPPPPSSSSSCFNSKTHSKSVKEIERHILELSFSGIDSNNNNHLHHNNQTNIMYDNKTIDLTDSQASHVRDELEILEETAMNDKQLRGKVTGVFSESKVRKTTKAQPNQCKEPVKKKLVVSNPVARTCSRLQYQEMMKQELKDAPLPKNGKKVIPPSSPQVSLSKFKTLSIQNVKLHNELLSCRSRIQNLEEEISLVSLGFASEAKNPETVENSETRKRKSVSDFVLQSLTAPVAFKVPMRPVRKKRKLNPVSENNNEGSTNRLPEHQKPLKRLQEINQNQQNAFTYLFKRKENSQANNSNNPTSSPGFTQSPQESQIDSGLGSSSSSLSSSSFNNFIKPKPKAKSSTGTSITNSPSMSQSLHSQSQIPEATRIAMAVAENSQKRYEILAQKEKGCNSCPLNSSSAPKTSPGISRSSSIVERFKALSKNIPSNPIPLRPPSFNATSQSQSVKGPVNQPSSSFTTGFRQTAAPSATGGGLQGPSRSQSSSNTRRLPSYPSIPVFDRTKNTWDRRVNTNK